jgi:hypothetical protein
MLGELLGETRGKRIVRRVLSSEPLKVEVSFEDSGKMFGTDVNAFWTYWSAPRADGTLYGEGEGVYLTGDGEMVISKGSGVGKLTTGGAVSYRGTLYYQTQSQNLAWVNAACGIFEFEVDAEGATHTKVWQWK